MDRLFMVGTDVLTWEPVEFENIKAGTKVKMLELSPNGDEVLSIVYDITSDTNQKTGCFEGHELTSMYIPVTNELREAFNNANK